MVSGDDGALVPLGILDCQILLSFRFVGDVKLLAKIKGPWIRVAAMSFSMAC
jgi:hypothetical protein